MYIFDIETDGLWHKLTKIHTIAIYDLKKNKMYSFDKQDVRKGVKMINKGILIGHNIIKFDIPVIQRFFPWFTYKKALDTAILSTFAWPDIGHTVDEALIAQGKLPKTFKGKYSLEAFGHRLGILKDNFHHTTDWKEWSPAMKQYCIQDVKVTLALWRKLEKKSYVKEAVALEHQVAKIVGRIERYGWYFDTQKALELENELRSELEDIIRQLQQIFPPKKIIMGYYKRANSKRNIKPGDPIVKYQEFNPGSTKQIIERLKEKYGYVPVSLTEKSNETISDEDLEKMNIPEGKLLLRYKQLKKWLGMLSDGENAWLKLYDSKTNRMFYSILSNGAVTGRMRHVKPNIAQVPKDSRFRALFRATPNANKKLVGVDASGLEFRCFANRVGDKDYIKVILEKDIHTENQRLAGLETRSQAKTFIYAFLYGGGDAKLGSIAMPHETNVNKLKKKGTKLRNTFLQAIPGLQKLYNNVTSQAKRYKYIYGLDGRKLYIRKLHKAVNTLLQSDGAIVMKRALVILDEKLQQAGFIPGEHYEFVGLIHDEFQIEVDEALAENVGQMAIEAIRKAGDYFKFKCPLDGEMKIGDTWAETH